MLEFFEFFNENSINPGDLFRSLDWNRDAIIDSFELDLYQDNKKRFNQAQKVIKQNKKKSDGNRRLEGTISTHEYEIASDFMEYMDDNGDGEITREEFSDFWDGLGQYRIDRRWSNFVANDLDGSQSLNIDELTASADLTKLERMHTRMINFWD